MAKKAIPQESCMFCNKSPCVCKLAKRGITTPDPEPEQDDAETTTQQQ